MWPPLACNIRVPNLREGIGEGLSTVEGQTTEFTIKRNSFEWVILHKGDRVRETSGGSCTADECARDS